MKSIFLDFSLPRVEGAQPDSSLMMYVHEHVVVLSPTKVGILAAHLLSHARCTKTSLLTQSGLVES